MRQNAQKLKLFASRPTLVLFVVTALLAISATGSYFLNGRAVAATNSTINFQARLMNNAGSIAADGDYNVEFKLYNALTSSGSSQGSCTGDTNCLWAETRTSTNKVHVANGYLTVSLGSVTTFPGTINWDQQLWLTMNIGGTGTPSWDGEMSPRLQLTAVPYAFRAGQLAVLSGVNTAVLQFAGSIGQNTTITLPDPGASSATICYQTASSCGFVAGTAANYIQNGTSLQTANFNVSGSGTAGTSFLTTLLDTPASGNTLAIGTSNATGGITLNQDTTVSGTKAFTVNGGLATLQGGLTANGGAVQLNVSSNNSTNINTGSSTGTVTIGNTSSSITLQGPVVLSNPATANTAAYLCKNASNQIASCATTGAGAAFVQGGNNFGATATLGAQDANNLQLVTNNITRGTFDTSNNLYLGNGITAAAPSNFTVSATGSSAATVAGAAITLTGGTGNTTGAGGQATIQGGASGNGAAAMGGAVTIQGGTANGTGASNGGTVTLQGGTLAGSGVKGLIQMNGGTYFTTGSYSSGSTSTITQSLVDSNSAILATATTTGLTFMVPSPTLTAASGRILYVSNAGSNPFTLAGAGSSFTLNSGSTATLLWNGSAWTSAGVDASTLQNVYNNSIGGSTPEVLLDSTRGGLDIQDTNSGLGSTVPLLAVRASASATTLGAALFTVNNNAGSPLVGVGTATPSRQLDVAVSNSINTAPSILVEQAGTGDTGIEMKLPSKSFYAGLDGSDAGKFKISSSTANTTGTTPMGYTSLGGTLDTGSGALIFCQQATATANGALTSISIAYGAPIDTAHNKYRMAVYANSAGSPGTLIAQTAEGTISAGWNTTGISVAITNGTIYWLCAQSNTPVAADNNPYYDTGGPTDKFQSSASYPSWPAGGWSSGGTVNFSMYATISTSGTFDTFATSLFSLGDTGQTVFSNSINSTAAFQVQNAALSTTVFGVDTQNSRVGIALGAAETPGFDLSLGGGADRVIGVNQNTSAGAGRTLTVQAGQGNGGIGGTLVLQGGAANGTNMAGGQVTVTGGTATGTATGGQLTLQGGAASATAGSAGGAIAITAASGSNTGAGGNGGAVTITAGNGRGTGPTNGGNIILAPGTAAGAGTKGVVQIGASSGSGALVNNGTTLNTVTTQSVSSGGAISNLDSFSAFVITVTSASQTMTLADPSPVTAGRTIYISNAASGSNLFTLAPAHGTSISLNTGATATLLWNGSAWTYAGADASSILNQTTAVQAAGFNIQPSTNVTGAMVTGAAGSTATTFILKEGTSQTGSMMQILDNSSNVYSLFAVGSTGGLSSMVNADSATAFQIQNASGATQLSLDTTNTSSSLNVAANGGGETSGTFTTNWTTHGTSTTISRDTTAGEFASGVAGVKVAVTASTTTPGVRNNIGTAMSASTTYIVSFSVKVSVAMTNANMAVVFSPAGTTSNNAICSTFTAANNPAINTTNFIKYTCTLTTTATTTTSSAYLALYQADATLRNIFIDNLSIVAQNSSGTQNTGTLRVGGASSQGLTLLTLDTYAGTPFTGTNPSLAGSMYFDTTQGKIQCYDGSSWGACGAAPNSIITLAPEYANAVLHGSGIGTMTSDFCSNSLAINDGSSGQPTICVSNQSYNFYKWTSPQGTAQTYSMYVTYQLPNTFKSFVAAQTSLVGRTDSTNSTVQYSVYRNANGVMTQCGSTVAVSTGSQSNWQTGTASGTADPSNCGGNAFAAGNSIVFKIDVIASNNANAYVTNLNFQFANQ